MFYFCLADEANMNMKAVFLHVLADALGYFSLRFRALFHQVHQVHQLCLNFDKQGLNGLFPNHFPNSDPDHLYFQS